MKPELRVVVPHGHHAMGGDPAAPLLLGTGLALPDACFDRERTAALLASLCPPPPARRRTWAALLRRSGVERRHSAVVRADDDTLSRLGTRARMALFAAHAPPLAEAAARRALQAARLEPARVTHLLSVSCTGLAAPGLGVDLVQRLGLSPDTERSEIAFMGCHGVLVALRQAAAIVRADPAARVLVAAVELCTLHVQADWDDEEAVAQALFADGAGAVLVGSPDAEPTAGDAARQGATAGDTPTRHGTATEADPRVRAGRPWRLLASGTHLLPEGRDLLRWDVDATGFRVTLSPRLPELVGEHLAPWLDGWLAARGMARRDVRGWAVHPGGPRILTEIERSLELAPDALAASREVLAQHGNMSSPSVLFVLDRLPREASPCVMLGLGPGPSFEVALLG